MSARPGTALITGASGGIGAVYADRLAKRGYDLVLVARDRARMEAVSDRLKGVGSKIEILVADLTKENDLSAVEARLGMGDISLLVNNAGMSLKGSLLENGGAEISKIIALNITAPARLAAAAAQGLLKTGPGGGINNSSLLAPAPGRSDGGHNGSEAVPLTPPPALPASPLQSMWLVKAASS